ncbi:MAG: hypothetical protein VKO44_00445 [Cyanobacteriota bacterium]|jgi:hypothetical protein|nr:hypothetical protein [Cyanobacteriota bacterium]
MTDAETDAAPAPETPTPLADALPLLEEVHRIACAQSGDPEALLQLLRHLEHLHRSIQDGPFRSSLPSERGSLFRLLQDMESSGGWPYIPRLQLRTFLDLLQSEAPGSPDVAVSAPADREPVVPEAA